MARRRTWAELEEWALAQPDYYCNGKRIPTRAEWEQFPRWRRWLDILFGSVPDEPRRYFEGL